MAVLGIVAEYNPFHNGHLHHLKSAVALVKPSAVLAVVSGPFTQRGELPLLSPWDRAACALDAGADAVFALPVLWTVRDAEHYALGAVSLLSSLGATHLAFGAETADLSLLEQAAELLEDPPDSFRCEMKEALSCGLGYPAALSRAAARYNSEFPGLLKQPNNILAVCYLRAVHRLHVKLEPVVIQRSGSYRESGICPASPSASAVRSALLRGVWHEVSGAVPPESLKMLQRRFLSCSVPDQKRLDSCLISKLRSMSLSEAAAMPGCSEGLDSALLKAASLSDSREALISHLTSRRYSSARISRLCACALLGITGDLLDHTPLPCSALFLGMKKNLSLTGSWKDFPLFSSPARWLASAGSAEQAAYRLWGLCSRRSGAFPYTEKMIIR